MMMSITVLVLFFFSSSPAAILSLACHVITPNPNTPVDVLPSCLAWDPTAQHFIIGNSNNSSSSAPALVFSVSDAGIVAPIVADHFNNNNSSIAAVAVDNSRRRLFAALSDPPAVAVYDLRSPRPHLRLLYSSLSNKDRPGGIAIDPTTGNGFITAGEVLYRVDADKSDGEESVAVVSNLTAFSQGFPLGGAVIVRGRGFLLVGQEGSGKLFKVDAQDGKARAVAVTGLEKKGLVSFAGDSSGVSVTMRADGVAVVAGGKAVRMLKSKDGWAEAVVHDEAEFGGIVKGVVVRGGREAYALVVEEKEKKNGLAKFRIEEIEWKSDSEGEMVWGMVLLGLGFVVLFFWRFQVKQLVTDMNKKRE